VCVCVIMACTAATRQLGFVVRTLLDEISRCVIVLGMKRRPPVLCMDQGVS
jgi:hypothetical protein